MERPQPRVSLGLALRSLAHAAIDVSDGLLADLSHLCDRSGLGAEINWPWVPVDAALAGLPDAERRRLALSGGMTTSFCSARRCRSVTRSAHSPRDWGFPSPGSAACPRVRACGSRMGQGGCLNRTSGGLIISADRPDERAQPRVRPRSAGQAMPGARG